MQVRPKGAPGRDKPVPYGEEPRPGLVGATLVVARIDLRALVGPGRDKPVPYGLLLRLIASANALPSSS